MRDIFRYSGNLGKGIGKLKKRVCACVCTAGCLLPSQVEGVRITNERSTQGRGRGQSVQHQRHLSPLGEPNGME